MFSLRGGSCGSMDATGYLKHNATVQVASGAVDCLFARELIRQFVVQNPAEVTDKANGERTVMSAPLLAGSRATVRIVRPPSACPWMVAAPSLP